MMRPLAELAGLVSPTGDELLHGLSHDLGLVPTLEQGWRRLCETAWALGLVNLRIIPDPAQEDRVPRWHAAAPGGGPVRSNWAFDVMVGPARLAVVTMGRGERDVAFDPLRLAAAVQLLLSRFVEPEAA